MKNRNVFPETRIYLLWRFLLILLYVSGNLVAQEATRQTVADTATVLNTEQKFRQLRGVEEVPKDGQEALRTTANVLLFIPRTLFDGLLYTTVYGAYLIDDRNLIAGVEDIFYLHGRVLGWYPQVTFGSGPAIGATVFYRTKVDFSVGGAYGGSQRWGGKVRLFHAFPAGKTVWQIDFSGRIIQREDYEFFGFGADPQNDNRNSFNPTTDKNSGIYAQRLTRIPLIIGMSPSPKWQFFYTGFYQERRLSEPKEQDDANIENVFGINTIPGLSEGQVTTGKQVYNEIAVGFDSRTFERQESPAIRLEGYGGISLGVSDDQSRFARAGFDASLFFPIIKHNRLIVPRLVFDMIENLNEEVEISFADYPRQPTFRGVSTNKLLRTDKYSLVPSIEYRWPLTFNLRAHIFLDYLLVSSAISKLTFPRAPYAYGFDIDLNSDEREIARLTFSYGSEGFRFLFNIGLGQFTSDRSKWQ
jgi:hypothetical protein